MAANNFKLFRQDTSGTSEWKGAPKLVPKGSGNGVVDIHANYAWTVSPKAARADIPFIIFEEYALDFSSLITNALYKIRGAGQNILAFGDTLDKAVGALNGEANKNFKDISALSSASAKTEATNPYAGMYAASPTGWSYVAPYLQALVQNVSNTWGNDSSNTLNSGLGELIKGTMNKASNLIDTTNIANITAPSSYAESAKFYNPSNPNSFSVTFPLFNTISVDDIINNWELCYLLTYQNLPNRRSINLLDPPSLYRVTIPGLRQSPVAYISGLSITHVGNIRNVDIYGNGLMKPIPEAYMIKIDFTDLLIQSRNIFQYALDQSQVIATVNANSSGQNSPTVPVSQPANTNSPVKPAFTGFTDVPLP